MGNPFTYPEKCRTPRIIGPREKQANDNGDDRFDNGPHHSVHLFVRLTEEYVLNQGDDEDEIRHRDGMAVPPAEVGLVLTALIGLIPEIVEDKKLNTEDDIADDETDDGKE